GVRSGRDRGHAQTGAGTEEVSAYGRTVGEEIFMARRKNRSSNRTPVRTSTPSIKLNPVWGSRKMTVLDGRQVRCMTFDEGSVWLQGLGEIPLLVRRRVADARETLCLTC